MNTEYRDIRERSPEPPKWFDECAVPRYCDFVPQHAADIYAREAALLMIECHSCGHQFPVCLSSRSRKIAEEIREGTLHYGDPPNIECCRAGPSMNCRDLRVLEYWRRNEHLAWQRDTAFEIELPRQW